MASIAVCRSCLPYRLSVWMKLPLSGVLLTSSIQRLLSGIVVGLLVFKFSCTLAAFWALKIVTTFRDSALFASTMMLFRSITIVPWLIVGCLIACLLARLLAYQAMILAVYLNYDSGSKSAMQKLAKHHLIGWLLTMMVKLLKTKMLAFLSSHRDPGGWFMFWTVPIGVDPSNLWRVLLCASWLVHWRICKSSRSAAAVGASYRIQEFGWDGGLPHPVV
jgi:hypothetical protein